MNKRFPKFQIVFEDELIKVAHDPKKHPNVFGMHHE